MSHWVTSVGDRPSASKANLQNVDKYDKSAFFKFKINKIGTAYICSYFMSNNVDGNNKTVECQSKVYRGKFSFQ